MNRDKLLRQWLPETISLNPIGDDAEQIWYDRKNNLYQDNIVFQVVCFDYINDQCVNPQVIKSFPISCKLGFEYYVFETSLPRKENMVIQFRYFMNDIWFSARFDEVKLSKKVSCGSYDCTLFITGDEVRLFNGDQWHLLCKTKKIEYTTSEEPSTIQLLENVDMSKQDYIMTLNSYYNRGSDNTYTLWYNNGRNCLIKIKDVAISFDGNIFYDIFLAIAKHV